MTHVTTHQRWIHPVGLLITLAPRLFETLFPARIQTLSYTHSYEEINSFAGHVVVGHDAQLFSQGNTLTWISLPAIYPG